MPFNQLKLIIDVNFSILEDNIPSLLSSKDMIYNGLGFIVQGNYLYVGYLCHSLLSPWKTTSSCIDGLHTNLAATSKFWTPIDEGDEKPPDEN